MPNSELIKMKPIAPKKSHHLENWMIDSGCIIALILGCLVGGLGILAVIALLVGVIRWGFGI